MTGLVLEGGGARGSYHVGAIKAFKKRGIKFDGVVGTSIGSINAAFVVSNQYRKLLRLWNNATLEKLFEIDSNLITSFKKRKFDKKTLNDGFKTIIKIVKNKGITTKNLRKLLKNNINEKRFRRSNIDFGLATFNITDKKPIQIYKKSIPRGKLVEYILASAYFPTFKFEKIIDDKYYIDGGVFDRCPLDMLLYKNYNTIYLIRTFRNRLKVKYNENIKLIKIQPKKNLGPRILFQKEKIKENMKLGYLDTLRVLDKMDGKKYYIKRKSNKYYSKLLDKKIKKKILNKYNLHIFKYNEKEIIINTIEEICTRLNINVYKIYNVLTLIFICKLNLRRFKNKKYYDFIKNIKLCIF